MIPFFVPPNESTSTPRSRVACRSVWPRLAAALAIRAPSMCRNILRSCAKSGQRLNLFRLVNRPHFGRLRDRDHPRLHMMLVADPVIGVPHRVERDLPILVRQRNQLASRMLFRRAAFVGIDVRVIAAQHRVIRPVQSLQSKHVCARSVEGEKNVDPLAECSSNFAIAERV